MRRKNTLKNYIAFIPFFLVVVCYELFPLGKLVINSIQEKNKSGITFANFIKIFETPLYRVAIINSVKIGIISALIGIIVAFFAAKAYHEAGVKFRDKLILILNMTSNFTGVPLAFAFMVLMGNTGVLTLIGQRWNIPILNHFNLYSGNGLLLIYIYFQIPLATLLMLPGFLVLKKEWKEAAYLLKASKFSFWKKIAIPNLLPVILGTLSVLFANALAAYATAYAIVTNNYALLSLQISSKFKGDVRIDEHIGGALAVILIAFMIITTIFNNYLTKKSVKGRKLVT